MRTKTKIAFGSAALFLVGLFYFMPLNARNVGEEYKSFKDCWGSGDFSKTCSYDGATVVGCQPDPGSNCMGVRNTTPEILP